MGDFRWIQSTETTESPESTEPLDVVHTVLEDRFCPPPAGLDHEEEPFNRRRMQHASSTNRERIKQQATSALLASSHTTHINPEQAFLYEIQILLDEDETKIACLRLLKGSSPVKT